jgi:hypothetical protein
MGMSFSTWNDLHMWIECLWCVVANRSGRHSVHDILQLSDVALGLKYLHSRKPSVIHGDLKGVRAFGFAYQPG